MASGNKTTGAVELTEEEQQFLFELLDGLEVQLDEAPLTYNREAIEAEFYRYMLKWMNHYREAHPYVALTAPLTERRPSYDV